mmetsp:Transcript_2610/g.5177  ORF Transcript_2610/g.5177 Transcript_2610/m.5177 type:complete len:386 (-) Transcript_2610:107-1264(-)|eukprot:scaffold34615_cov180-Amphora_coffeaeformis.AAC.17
MNLTISPALCPFVAFLLVALHVSSFVAAEHRNLRFGHVFAAVDNECPESYPQQGTECVSGLVCEYDYIARPTVLADGTCTEPLICTPITKFTCGKDGLWEPQQVAAAAFCEVPPKGMDMPCTPVVPCPEEMPEASTKCESSGLLCKYDYIFTPQVNADGSCSEPFSCGPPARVRCGENGLWGDPIVWDMSCPKNELSVDAYTPCMAIQPIDEECPAKPSTGGMCRVGLSCNYDYINIPTIQDGTCTDTLICRSMTRQVCTNDGFWHAPTTMDLLPCPNEDDLPVGAYQPCDINPQLDQEVVNTECPELSPSLSGEPCQEAGLQCGYDYAWLPTVLDGGMCQEPVSCAPQITMNCQDDGVWGDIMMQSFACIGVDLPDNTFTPCAN